MSRKYVCSEVISEWFNDFDCEKDSWVIDEIIDDLFNALVDTNQLMKECGGGDQAEARLRTINKVIVSALTDMRRLMKEIARQIEDGDILSMGGKRGGKGGEE